MLDLGLAKQAAVTFASFRFITWGYEKKYELGEEPKPHARTIRWLIVFLSFLLMYCPGNTLGMAVRILGGITGGAFFCWPNFSNRVVEAAQQYGLLKPSADATEVSLEK